MRREKDIGLEVKISLIFSTASEPNERDNLLRRMRPRTTSMKMYFLEP